MTKCKTPLDIVLYIAKQIETEIAAGRSVNVDDYLDQIRSNSQAAYDGHSNLCKNEYADMPYEEYEAGKLISEFFSTYPFNTMKIENPIAELHIQNVLTKLSKRQLMFN